MSAKKQAARDVEVAHGEARQPRKTHRPTGDQSAASQAELRARRIARLEALEPSEKNFIFGLFNQLAPLDGENNSMLGFVNALGPRDTLEMLLLSQMAAIHQATLAVAARVAVSENILEHDSSQQALNKLARTFVTQMEALQRYRSGGEQKVTVQHVNVGEGGQAIVGNVTQAQTEARSERVEKAVAAAPLLTDVKSVPMTPIDASRTRLRVAARRGARR